MDKNQTSASKKPERLAIFSTTLNSGEIELDIRMLTNKYVFVIKEEIETWMINTSEKERVRTLTEFISKNDGTSEGIMSWLCQIKRQAAHQALKMELYRIRRIAL